MGASLQAELNLALPPSLFEQCSSLGDDLRFVFIVSKVTLTQAEAEAITVTASTAAKCERCWHQREDVGHDAAHPTLCKRCTSNLFGAGETREFA